jgi:signal transduction histidine kinase
VRVLSAHADAIDAPTALAAVNIAQISGYVSKPWRADQLLECLRNALDSRHADSTLRNMGMRLWHRGQVAAAATIYEELVHELSNPLGALEINATVVEDQLCSLLDGAPTPELVRATLESALEAHSDALAAIEQIKGLVSRMRHGRVPALVSGSGHCDAASVIDATVRIVRAEIERVASLEVELEALPREVQMDAHALGQVLLNLLLNAAQACDVEARIQHRVRVRAREHSGQFELTVQDNGVGINEDHLERIFEPSFTTKEHGTGLGLAICRDLIAQAYGTIRVRSRPGNGAEFEIFVPIAGAD